MASDDKKNESLRKATGLSLFSYSRKIRNKTNKTFGKSKDL